MAKRVELTWVSNGDEIVEECWLLSDDDEIFLRGSGVGINLITNDGVGNTVEALNVQNHVVFEDDEGIFMLPASQIVHIRLL